LHGKTPCFREAQFCFTRIEPDEVVSRASDKLALRKEQTPAAIIDRDGTIIVDKNYLSDPEQVELIPGAAGALAHLKENGYKLVIVSNQSGVARGMFGIDDVERVNGRVLDVLLAEGVEIDALYYCPYYRNGSAPEYAIDSDWRKPSPGMAEQAALDLNLDLRRSIVIGDKIDDVSLGRVLGARSFLVKTGHGVAEAAKLPSDASRVTVMDSLADIRRFITGA
jgi:histidinol-phosphate phosphatase family protein